MKKKIIVGIVMLIVLAVTIVSVGVFSRPEAAPTPTPMPTATPRPTPIASPTASSQVIITAQEFITNAQAGKYKTGDVVRVSAAYDDVVLLSKAGIPIFFFGPAVNGQFLAVEATSSVGEFNRLKKGERVIITGEFSGFYESPEKKGVLLKWGHVV